MAGIALLAAFSLKAVALPTLGAFAVFHWLFARNPPRRIRTIALVTLLATAAPGVAAISMRSTTINNGKLSLGSSKVGGDMLLGHYGKIGGLVFTDYAGNSPSQGQHGQMDWKTIPHSFADTPANAALAWKWTRENPVESFVLSCEHVVDTFGGTLPWPSLNSPHWPGAQGHHYLYLVFLLLPTLVRLLDVWRAEGFVGLLASRQLLLFSPLLALSAIVFIATGEARYRVPYDALFIVLSIDFFRHWGVWGSVQARWSADSARAQSGNQSDCWP